MHEKLLQGWHSQLRDLFLELRWLQFSFCGQNLHVQEITLLRVVEITNFPDIYKIIWQIIPILIHHYNIHNLYVWSIHLIQENHKCRNSIFRLHTLTIWLCDNCASQFDICKSNDLFVAITQQLHLKHSPNSGDS